MAIVRTARHNVNRSFLANIITEGHDMKLLDFLADKSNPHTAEGNPSVKCNALYKTKDNFNCYLTPSQAIELAQHLLKKAQLILDHDIEDTAVQVWNQGESTEKLYFGLIKIRKGARRKKPVVEK